MPTLLLLRLTALLTVLVVAWQFVSAGLLLTGGSALGAHATGAIALHVTTGLAAVAAVAHWRAERGPVWPAVLAVVLFAVTFAQAWTGSHSGLDLHVPGALVVTVGSVWLLTWSFVGSASRTGRLAR